MSTAACSAADPPSSNPKSRNRRRWEPDRKAHLIYQWVKMEGKDQTWVANDLRISQATVSRIVQRYERWQAHAKQREGGRLDHSERLRAQRWLTFERNELILASCLRIAHEMEGFIDVSKDTITRPLGNPKQENEVRTQHSVLDRSGVAARFLRLAYRINMEQLKLAQLDEPPPAEELSDEELAEEERLDAAADQELREAERRREEEHAERVADIRRQQQEDLERNAEMRRLREIEEAERQALAKELEQPANQTELGNQELLGPRGPISPNEPPEPTAEPTTEADASLHNLHNLHNASASENGATAAQPCSCEPPPRSRKKSPTCITEKGKSQWTDNGTPSGAKRRRATAK